MGIIVETFIMCDGEDCSENFGVDNKTLYNAQQQRQSAIENGWFYKKGKYYCPSCRKNQVTIRKSNGGKRIDVHFH